LCGEVVIGEDGVQLDRVLPLSRYRIFTSSAPDELKGFLAKKRLDLRIDAALPGGVLAAEVNAAYLPGMYLSSLAYGGEVGIAAPPDRTDYALQIPLTGALEALSGNTTATPIGRGHAAVGSPGRDQIIRSTADCTRMIVSLGRDTVVRQLAALLGDAVEQPLVFDTDMALEQHAAGIAGLLRWAVAELERSPSLLQNPLAAMELEQLLATALLVGQGSNYRDRLRAPQGNVCIRSVKRAVDFIQAHAGQPLTLADLVAASGVPGRTLHKHFRLSKGMSPMAYLRGVRLQRVRADLLHDDGTSVSTVAMRWGFDHLGRFAAEYRKRFGEAPSVTHRRRR
jgi:AraC-like DNA-binding protein